MKKISCLIIIIIISAIVKGQERELAIGIIGSPDLYYYDIKPVYGENHKLTSKFNYSIGFRFQYDFSKKILINSGFFYSTKGYIMDWEFIVSDPGDPMLPVETNLKVKYLDIPINIGYRLFNNEKIKILSSGGPIFGLLIDNKETSIFGDNSEIDSRLLNKNLNQAIFSINFNFGLEYYFHNNLFLSIVPFFTYGLNKMDENFMNSNQFCIGTNIGFYYRFIRNKNEP